MCTLDAPTFIHNQTITTKLWRDPEEHQMIRWKLAEMLRQVMTRSVVVHIYSTSRDMTYRYYRYYSGLS